MTSPAGLFYDGIGGRISLKSGEVIESNPGNIVGAIANGAGIGNESIGTIRIFDRVCGVDLPANFPQDLLETLRIVMIAGQSPRMPQMAGSLPVRGHVKDGQRLQNTPFQEHEVKARNVTTRHSNRAFISETSTIGCRNDGE